MSKLYTLFLILLYSPLACAQSIMLEIKENGVLFTENEVPILFYQTAEKSHNGQYSRTNYVHPLYSLDGKILSEDFPEDHLHHRGVFWAWHQLYIGDQRIGDGWEIKDFKWEVLSVEKSASVGAEKKISAHIVWKSPLWLNQQGQEQPFVSENTTITVYPAKINYREIDFEISLLALEPNMRIGGSEDPKGYGGFSPRIRLAESMIFTSSTGEVSPQSLPIEAGPWMDIAGPLGVGGARAGVTIFSHPKNPKYPNPWILRSKDSMQNAVYPHPGAKAVNLSNLEPTVLRYRLVIHQGLSATEIARLYQQY